MALDVLNVKNSRVKIAAAVMAILGIPKPTLPSMGTYVMLK